MDFRQVILVLAICSFYEFALADWREDVGIEHVKANDKYVKDELTYIEESVNKTINSLQKFANSSYYQLMLLDGKHKTLINTCISFARNKTEAERCCKTTLNKTTMSLQKIFRSIVESLTQSVFSLNQYFNPTGRENRNLFPMKLKLYEDAWKEEMKKKYENSGYAIPFLDISEMFTKLSSTLRICSGFHESLVKVHQTAYLSGIKKCTQSAANENEAQLCCDDADNKLLKSILDETNSFYECSYFRN